MLSQMYTEIEAILTELDTERSKAAADKTKMQQLVDRLWELGVYHTTPVMEKHNYSALQMVEGWGVCWHEYQEPLSCPACKADWRNYKTGPPFKREIGLYDSCSDRTMLWKCPDCGEEFPRSKK